jgi:hypothetical protein
MLENLKELQLLKFKLLYKKQLGGIYGNLTTELLTPYLNRKLHLLQRSNKVPSLPKGLVSPVVVAGIYGVGRGQDRQALMEFVTTVSQGMGPEAMMQYINPEEFLKRLAAASGIDTLGLIKSAETMQKEQMDMQNAQMQESLIGQAGQLAKSPMGEQLTNQMMNNGTEETEASQEA